jgi:hypothetical protein
MAFRYPTSIPRSLEEQHERMRELLRQLEPIVFQNIEVGTVETPIAHGQKSVPRWVKDSTPHSLSRVRQTRPPDAKNVYFRASKACVIDLLVVL